MVISTKGNLTQLCNLDNSIIDGIYDVNKRNLIYTPGSK